ncbi:DUF2970 domain-containing protein [Caldimonas brevitalea]|uniref:Membrane protein n=1 Tax=Caldimonas brevitalea TaxID=413882 RepID=A0A0G3BKA6_9BURK|nr:DUF2970 domain-containing protein [Caldimonas brevitalea]AKJ27791.1 membrane protein [Caldimonas brevitalea]
MNEPRRPEGDLRAAVRRKGSFWQSMRAVAWSFFGVRKSSEHEKDLGQLNPVHVIVAGLVAAALFVIALVLLVRWVIGSGVAAG